MEIEKVNTIKFIRNEIQKLLLDMVPLNDDEWQLHDELTSIYKTMRKWDMSKLTQTRMDLSSPPEAAKQIPLTEAAAVVPGEDSLTDRHDTIVEAIPEANAQITVTQKEKTGYPDICERCAFNDQCNHGGVLILNDEEKCREYQPAPDVNVICSGCAEYHNCNGDKAAIVDGEQSCPDFHPADDPAPKKRGRKPKSKGIPESEL